MSEIHYSDSEYYPMESVDIEVLRGKQIQKEKSKKHSIPTNYDVVDIKYDKLYAPSTAPYCRYFNDRSHLKGKNRYKNNKNKSDGNYFKSYKNSKTLLNKRNRSRRCSIRILELAVPTKRHCLETWRNNYNILPDYRVERLRQIVMDEKPVIDLHEAVNYFQRKKMKSHRSLGFQNKTTNVKHSRQIKIFCSTLAYKIIQKLLPSTNIKLDNELQNISKVIQNDLRTLSKKCNTIQDFRMELEIADKLTLWISNVIEDSNIRLLLDDFEELKKIEEPVWNIIDNLINTIIVTCEPETKDSESTFDEGVENIDFKNQGNDISEQIVLDILEQSMRNSEQQYIDRFENLNDFVCDIINEVINTNLGSISSETDMSPDTNTYSENKQQSSISNDEENETLGLITEDKLVPNLKNTDADIIDDNFIVNQVSQHSEKTSITEQNEMEGNFVNENKITAEEKQQEGSVDEDSTKKVKFSKLYIGNKQRGNSIRSYDLNRNKKHSQEGLLQNNSKTALSIAPPNGDLLSDADESWPEDLEFPPLKATISVSKSIQSLGKIVESDEKSISIPEDIDGRFNENSLELFQNEFIGVKPFGHESEGNESLKNDRNFIDSNELTNTSKTADNSEKKYH